MSPTRRSRIVWAPAPPAVEPTTTTRGLEVPAPPSPIDRAILAAGVPSVSDAPTPKDDAIGLLQLAAEVEHALLVQYLYAAASIDSAGGPDNKVAHNTLTTIAIQEMGHLVAVQNLLLAIGGVDAHHLGRDGIRATSDRNPLPLVLEPISHSALAKFVSVESPEEIPEGDLKTRVDALREEAETAAGFSPHPVSALYAAIYWIFQPGDEPFGPLSITNPAFRRGWHLKPADFLDGTTIDRLATLPEEWGGFPGLTITTVHGAEDGCQLLFDIMEQGEGAPGGKTTSHFAAFLSILDLFEANRLKVLPACRSPRVTDQLPSEDPLATPLTHPYTESWGRLFNIRYTHLVWTIGHSLTLAVDDPDRLTLIQLALTMMRPGLSGLIRQLLRLKADAAGALNAGPPFGLLDDSLPSAPNEAWERHRTLAAAEASAVATIRSLPDHAADSSGRVLLQQLATIDQPLTDLLDAHPQKPSGDTPMKYAIYPPIGFARIGNSTTGFFIGPERPGSRGTEILADGSEAEVMEFKDATFRVKPQGARFQLFEVPADGTPPRPAVLPAGATVRWSVRIVNKKDAINRPGSPPSQPTKPVLQPGREDRVIDSGVQTIAGASAQAVQLLGRYQQTDVRLGEIRTDARQQLIVVGAQGISASPSGANIGGSFYNNANWYDDLGDGPVTAEVVLAGGGGPVPCSPAWVLVGPPDFAPPCQGVVTLYDVILQVALDKGWTTLPARPSFVEHVRPMLERARNLQHVNNGAMWPLISGDWTALADSSAAAKQLREDNAGFVRAAEDQLHDFTFRDWQQTYLNQWVAGAFDAGPAPDPQSATVVTRTALDGSVGQGFFPGIEAGIIVTDPALYSQPFDFRFDHAVVSPGDITALMAQPWQADFLKCNGSWWPAQRPDLAPQETGARPAWLRPTMNHKRLVADVMKLGVISEHKDAAGQDKIFETGRDPQLH